jgi:hypothetical protein
MIAIARGSDYRPSLQVEGDSQVAGANGRGLITIGRYRYW